MPAHRSLIRPTEPLPVRSDDDAVELLALAVTEPMEPEVLCFVLDASGRGSTLFVVDDIHGPDAVLDVADLMCRAAEGSPARYLVVASTRPDGGLEPDDDWRFAELDALATSSGLDLLEWYVITSGE